MLRVYAVRDVKADAFGSLIVCPTKGLALRAFADACADQRSPMAQYPEDYNLYELGTFEPNSGELVGHKVPVHVASASSVVETLREARKPKADVVEEVR